MVFDYSSKYLYCMTNWLLIGSFQNLVEVSFTRSNILKDENSYPNLYHNYSLCYILKKILSCSCIYEYVYDYYLSNSNFVELRNHNFENQFNDDLIDYKFWCLQ